MSRRTKKPALTPTVRDPRDYGMYRAILWEEYVSSIWDSGLGSSCLESHGSNLEWVNCPPNAYRACVEPVLPSIEDVPHALIQLAISRSLAYSVTIQDLARWTKQYRSVVVAPGESRFDKIAGEDGRIEAFGMPLGTALLIDSFPEDFGRMLVDRGGKVALLIFGSFYAVQVKESGFQVRNSFGFKRA